MCLTAQRLIPPRTRVRARYPQSDIRTPITLPLLLAKHVRRFDEVMIRRTYHLPPNIDQALAQHAKANGTSPAVVVRNALSTYLAIEGATLRTAIELDALRQEQRACFLLIKSLVDRLAGNPSSLSAGEIPNRVRERFDRFNGRDEQSRNGND